MPRSGPLAGIRVVELAGIGPGPFCGMLLADLGAEVVVIDRPGGAYALFGLDATKDVMARGKRSVVLNLKDPADLAKALALVEKADALIEGNRPGVTERLGIGPEDCLARNSRLVYGRMTGWGQTGPYANWAGHDIDYIAITGALHACGREGEPPAIPQNFVGDMGGGGMLLAFGLCAAIIEAKTSGKGQVVDAAMIEGAAALVSGLFTLRANGKFSDVRGESGGTGKQPFYDTYLTADGGYLAVGAIEPQFYAAFLKGLALDDPDLAAQHDESLWPEHKRKIAARIAEKSRAEWMAIFGSEACVAPVLDLSEVEHHPHNQARQVFLRDAAGVLQQAPAPRFSRTPGAIASPPPRPGADTGAVFADWGVGVPA